VAEYLYVRQAFVSKLKSGEREAGISSIEVAIRKRGISPAFFFRQMARDPHYSDWQGPHRIPPNMGYPAFQTFLKLAAESGLNVTDAERKALQEQEWPGYPTVQSYLMMLQAVRALEFTETTEVRPRSQPDEDTVKAGSRPRKA
jgi:hypothetical protein